MSRKAFTIHPTIKGLLCTCGECGATADVAVGLGRYALSKGVVSNEAEKYAVKRLTSQGWSYVGKKLRCPECIASEKKDHIMAKAEPPREASRLQRREILKALDEFYSEAGQGYMGGETDNSIGEMLGVLPGWVTELREQFYGPIATNEDMDDLHQQIDDLTSDLNMMKSSIAASITDINKKLAEVSAMKVKLERIMEAVGKHTLKKAALDISH